jgi:[ribosomal protein S18]-alanine N-acetyltransferase
MSKTDPSSDAVIVRMTGADLEAVASLEGAAFPSSTSTEPDRTARLREELARPWSRTWVTRADGRIVAFALVWHVADEVHLLNLATLPDQRRRGYARSLLEHVVQSARTGGGRQVLLEVRRSNAPAIALYRRHGFVATGLRRKYYDDDEDAVEMALSLDPTTGDAVPRTDEVRLD